MDAVDPNTLDSLREQLGGQEEVLQRVLGLYLGELPGRMDAIRQALEQQDARALRDAAHSLRGSSVTLGANLVAQICEQLELDAEAGKLSSAPGLLERLEPAAASTEAAFRAEVERTD